MQNQLLFKKTKYKVSQVIFKIAKGFKIMMKCDLMILKLDKYKNSKH